MRILVTGASGQLGSYLLRELAHQGKHEVIAWSGTQTGERFGYKLQPVNLNEQDSALAAFSTAEPDAIIHLAAIATAAIRTQDRMLTTQVNVSGTWLMGTMSARQSRRLVVTSSDLVFGGDQSPYREDSNPSPVSIYGATKKMAESVQTSNPQTAIARLSLLAGPSLTGRPNFFDQQIAALYSRKPMPLFVDEWRTPLDFVTAARGLIELAESDYPGILHMGGPERLSRYEMGVKLAQVLNLDPSVFVPTERAAVPAPEPRPRDVSLDSSKWRAMTKLRIPTYEEALREMLGK